MIVRIEIPDSVGPELDRLRALVGDTNMRMRIVTEGVQCTRAEWDEYRALLAEVQRLKREGSPGVVHAVDKSFHELAIRERDFERGRADRLACEVQRLRDRLALLERRAHPMDYDSPAYD